MSKFFIRNPQRAVRKQAGFTLVEMSVVLLVIGLILGAVSIGKDLQRDAEYVKIKQKFIDQWAVAYNTYYERTGVVLGDSQTAPNFMVNGASFPLATSGSTGTMVGATLPNAICDAGAQTVVSPTVVPLRAQIGSLYDEMDRHGVRMPPGRAEGSEARYSYLDSNGNPQEVQVCFQWNPPNTPSNSGNVMVISGLTPDLARALDQMIDGKPDAREGMFRQVGVSNATVGVPGVEWAANNTNAQGLGLAGAAAAAAASGLRLDEDQVITVVAHYKMNQ
jgi:prepilin-type N-terminal cleavage/methylation domain-containing protein